MGCIELMQLEKEFALRELDDINKNKDNNNDRERKNELKNNLKVIK